MAAELPQIIPPNDIYSFRRLFEVETALKAGITRGLRNLGKLAASFLVVKEAKKPTKWADIFENKEIWLPQIEEAKEAWLADHPKDLELVVQVISFETDPISYQLGGGVNLWELCNYYQPWIKVWHFSLEDFRLAYLDWCSSPEGELYQLIFGAQEGGEGKVLDKVDDCLRELSNEVRLISQLQEFLCSNPSPSTSIGDPSGTELFKKLGKWNDLEVLSSALQVQDSETPYPIELEFTWGLAYAGHDPAKAFELEEPMPAVLEHILEGAAAGGRWDTLLRYMAFLTPEADPEDWPLENYTPLQLHEKLLELGTQGGRIIPESVEVALQEL